MLDFAWAKCRLNYMHMSFVFQAEHLILVVASVLQTRFHRRAKYVAPYILIHSLAREKKAFEHVPAKKIPSSQNNMHIAHD